MFADNLIGKDWAKFEDYRANRFLGLKTGFPEMDRKIIGLPGLVTFMGEPKCCKSTAVMSIALNKAIEGHPVIYMDKENGMQRARMRMICYLAGITRGAVLGELLGDEVQRYNKAATLLKSLPICYLIENISAETLEATIKEAGKVYRKNVVVVVDSLQKIITDFKDRRASVDYWVFLFNELKQRYENWVTIIVVSEKNRSEYGTASKSGGKESGGIEYTSELVLDLYPSKDKSSIIIECTYNRDGPTGVLSKLIKPTPYDYRLKEAEYCPE